MVRGYAYVVGLIELLLFLKPAGVSLPFLMVHNDVTQQKKEYPITFPPILSFPSITKWSPNYLQFYFVGLCAFN